MQFEKDDGGRKAAGYKGRAGDCVPRAIAIATGISYDEAFDLLFAKARKIGVLPNDRKVYQAILEDLGWRWVPRMKIGSGSTMSFDEVPDDRKVIARLSGHLSAVLYGTVRDLYHPGCDRCVYGYFEEDSGS